MSEIQSYLTKIISAVYGREVRQSIHDAIQTCYSSAATGDEAVLAVANAAGLLADEAKTLAEETKGGVVLWTGAAMTGAELDFTIPKKCFHHNGTTLTLMIESYTRADGENAAYGNAPVFLTMVIGTLTELIGSEMGSGYNPYVNGNGYSTAIIYRNAHEYQAVTDNLIMNLKAKKTVDDRYAVGIFTLDVLNDIDIVVTCISALVPKDMEEET